MVRISKISGLVFMMFVLAQICVAGDITCVDGHDTNMSGRDDQIIVSTLGIGKWIGCTIFCNGEEIDLPVQSNSYVVTFRIPNDVPKGNHKAVVATWKKKVNNCGCYHCRKNGYHLEGEVDRKYFTIYK